MNYNNALCDYNIARAKLEKAVAKRFKINFTGISHTSGIVQEKP